MSGRAVAFRLSPTDSCRYITRQAELEVFLRELEESKVVAWDTEFARGKGGYHPELCLLQVRGDNGACAAVDPLADGQDLDLRSFARIFRDPGRVTVGHALRQDMEIAIRRFGCYPVNPFDTQIAALFCGALSYCSYAALAERYSGRPLNKKLQFSNWSRRPLSDKQIVYAMEDVRWLPDIYVNQAESLRQAGRTEYAREETALIERDLMRQCSGEAAFRKLPLTDAHLASDEVLCAASALCAWRENKASELNLPRAAVLSDRSLLALSEGSDLSVVTSDEEAFNLKDQIPGRDQFAVVPAFKPSPAQLRLRPDPEALSALRAALNTAAEREHLPPDFIAVKAELMCLLCRPFDKLSLDEGWRSEVFGREARGLVEGTHALDLKEGRVRFFRL